MVRARSSAHRLASYRRAVLIAAACVVSGPMASAVAPVPGSRSGNVTRGCVDRFDAHADYFPDKVTIEDAANFTVTYARSYKTVTVKQAYAGGPGETYVLVQCGTPATGARRRTGRR